MTDPTGNKNFTNEQQKRHLYQMPFLSHRGREIRTPIDGFGDRCSAIELYPYILFSCVP